MAIFISAGHSNIKGRNYDPGAVNKKLNITEADYNQDFETLVTNELTKRGVKYITDTPTESLSEYLKRIKTGNGSVILEFHFDASGTGKASGSTALVGDDADKNDKAFAKELVDATASILGISNRGVKSEAQSHRGRLGLMRKEGIVSLLEIAFLDNCNDVGAYNLNKEKLAKKVVDILVKYENLIK